LEYDDDALSVVLRLTMKASLYIEGHCLSEKMYSRDKVTMKNWQLPWDNALQISVAYLERKKEQVVKDFDKGLHHTMCSY